MATELTATLIHAAKGGDDNALDTIFKHFEQYVKGWAWREANGGGFAGTLYGADDLANILRERIWLAVQKFDEKRIKGDVVKGFVNLCKAYMAAGMWMTRNKGHRQQRMPKERVTKEFVEKRTRNKTGKLVVERVEVVGGEIMQSSAPVSISGFRHDGNAVEAERLIARLRVEIDFDFNLFMGQLRAELARRDPYLPMILNMLWEGMQLKEIAAVIGTSAEHIFEIVDTEIRPLAVKFM